MLVSTSNRLMLRNDRDRKFFINIYVRIFNNSGVFSGLFPASYLKLCVTQHQDKFCLYTMPAGKTFC